MEVAISALGTLFGGGGAAATAGAAATGAAATGAASAGGLLGALGSTAGILSGGLSVLSALRSYRAGEERALEANFAANQADAQRTDQVTEGVARRTGIKRELLRVLGENDVNAAAAGVDLAYGVGRDLRETATSEADFRLASDRAVTDARTADLTARALNYRRIARGMRQSGTLNAALDAGQGLLSAQRRTG